MSNSYKIAYGDMDIILEKLRSDYRIVAPRRYDHAGSDERGYIIRYGDVRYAEDIVYDEPSDFSPKEVIHPIMQTLMYFDNGECVESELRDDRKVLIFVHPCDVHGIMRLDTIFLKNGDHEDAYYKRIREKVKFAVMECGEGWDGCFCVSMGTNTVEKQHMAVRFCEDHILAEINDEELNEYFKEEVAEVYSPKFVEENSLKVTLPVIKDKKTVRAITEADYWKQYDEKCLSCGSCNTVCISCSCFDTVDVIYDETSLDGERRRKWSSCMLDDFSKMAGGHNVRSTAGSRTRFKMMHKVYDYSKRFGEGKAMCVGCGRCSRKCPEDIDFAKIINDAGEIVAKLEDEGNV